ncbi:MULTISPECIES: hypothetical protein [unclassified Pseudomonas]|uniref:hypothetical protein n=1 Tax=unclassified Pseudomonas TaxID=196821 RepID=UPI001C44A66F|nr:MULTISPECIES: hypothetical protein [unclassified Pseudomonas]
MKIAALIASLIGLVAGVATQHAAYADPINSTTTIVISYSNQGGCSFSYSPVNFCDEKHTKAIEEGRLNIAPNFFGKYIVVIIPERNEYNQSSVVAIDSTTNMVYPVPIDAFSANTSKNVGRAVRFGIESNKLCINGNIVAGRVIESGTFCFYLDGNKFTGHKTAYTY